VPVVRLSAGCAMVGILAWFRNIGGVWVGRTASEGPKLQLADRCLLPSCGFSRGRGRRAISRSGCACTPPAAARKRLDAVFLCPAEAGPFRGLGSAGMGVQPPTNCLLWAGWQTNGVGEFGRGGGLSRVCRRRTRRGRVSKVDLGWLERAVWRLRGRGVAARMLAACRGGQTSVLRRSSSRVCAGRCGWPRQKASAGR